MRKALFSIAFVSVFGGAFAQNLISNPSFETETDAGTKGSYVLSAAIGATPAAQPDSWTFVPSAALSDSQATSYYTAQQGKWLIYFGAGGDPNSDTNPAQSSYDSLQQTVTTVANQKYTLSYYLLDSGLTPGFVFNSTWDNKVITGSQVSDNVPSVWTQYSFTVTGTGSDTVGLNGYDASSFGSLDSVSLVQAQAVPAPGSIFALGLGVTGLLIRRRRA